MLSRWRLSLSASWRCYHYCCLPEDLRLTCVPHTCFKFTLKKVIKQPGTTGFEVDYSDTIKIKRRTRGPEMKRNRSKTSIATLALCWLVITSFWAPASVLAHITGELHSSHDQVVELYVAKASSDSCHMDDCSGSVDKVTDCQYVCQYYLNTVEIGILPDQNLNTFVFSSASLIKYPSLAMLERPPKHFA